jgi:hypothetical protein
MTISFLGTYPIKMYLFICQNTFTIAFATAVLTVVRTWKLPKCSPPVEWIKKLWGNIIRYQE